MEVKVVVPSDINTTAGGLKFEDKMWGVDVDNETIKRKGNTLYAVPPKQIEFATEAEMDKGENSPKDKAISAYEYQREIRCVRKSTALGLFATVSDDAVYCRDTALGYEAGYHSQNDKNNLSESVIVGYNAGVEGIRGFNTFIGYRAGAYINANESCVLGWQNSFKDNAEKTKGQYNVNLIGARIIPRYQESNYFQLGGNDTQNIYTSATYSGKGYNKTSDMRSKRVIQRLSTLDNGINVYLFQYLDNGMMSIGWMAQEVEELLRDKGYDEQIIEIAIPRSHDVDWQATIEKFQNDVGSTVKSWTEAQELHERLANQYLTENGITESYEEFMRNMEIYFEDKEKNPPAEVTPENAKREEIYANLKAKDLNNYLTYADDIRRIDESIVNNLL